MFWPCYVSNNRTVLTTTSLKLGSIRRKPNLSRKKSVILPSFIFILLNKTQHALSGPSAATYKVFAPHLLQILDPEDLLHTTLLRKCSSLVRVTFNRAAQLQKLNFLLFSNLNTSGFQNSLAAFKDLLWRQTITNQLV